MHIIIFLHHDSKLHTPDDINSLISAQLPDLEAEPELYQLVIKHMVYGPCGTQNPNSPCMIDGKCSKNFPKAFREHTTLSEDSYSCLKRPNNGRTAKVGNKEIDNRWVVPYSPWFLWRYRCHINMECVISVKAIKYIYKYVYKGYDHTTMEFGKSHDEIKLYLDARYVSACEGFWRITQSIMHQEFPHIVHLQVHLEGQHLVSWREDNAAPIQEIVDQAGNKDTTLMGYFKANEKYPEARQLLYQDMPLKFTWNKSKRIWSPRKNRQFCLGCMYYAHPSSGE